MFSRFSIQQRYLLCFLIFTGLVTNYMLRINMSIAIVTMSGGSSGNSSQSPCADNSTDSEGGEEAGSLGWTGTEVSWVLTAFFIGYAFFQMLGGRLAEIFGTKLVFGISQLGVAVLALVTPVLAKQSVWIVFVGVLEAFAFPALNHMISMWVPEKEKSAFVSFAYVGGTFGSIITNPMCGAILATLGWEAVFYITASITVVWCVAWFLLVVDRPEQSRLMTQEERDHILANRNYDDSVQSQDDVPIIPLLIDMLKCPPMLALMMCDFANSWGLYVLVSLGPTFFWEVGILSSLPYLGRFIGAQIIGQLSSFIRRRDLLAPFTLQRINASISFLLPAAGMVWLSQMTSSPYLCTAIMSLAYSFNGAIYAGHSLNSLTIATNRYGVVVPVDVQPVPLHCHFHYVIGMVWLSQLTSNPYLCVAIMSIAYTTNGAHYSGDTVNMLQIAPNKSGLVMGLSNGFGSIAGIFIPLTKDLIVGSPVTCDQMVSRWQIMYYIPSVIYVVATLNFLIFSSGEVQKFDSKKYKKKYCFLW